MPKKNPTTPKPSRPPSQSNAAPKSKLGVNTSKTPWLKILIVSVVVSFFLLLALHTRLFSLFKIEDYIEKRFLTYADSYTDKPFANSIVILLIENDASKNGALEKFGPGWRKHHRTLIDLLAKAGAKVIAFDLHFENVSPEFDEELGRSIQKAGELGTTVILGVRNYQVTEGKAVPRLSPALANYLKSSNWALLDIGVADRKTTPIHSVKLGDSTTTTLPDWIATEKQSIVPSFPLQVVAQYWATKEPATAVFETARNQVSIEGSSQHFGSIPVDQSLHFVFQLAEENLLEKVAYPYSDVLLQHSTNAAYLRNEFQGKIVLVGVRAEDELRTVSGDDKRYGVEILASATSNILQSAYIKPLSNKFRYLLLLVMGFVGGLLGSRFRGWLSFSIPVKLFHFTEFELEIPTALIAVSGAYLLLAVFVYLQTSRILDFSYQIAALVTTYYLMRIPFNVWKQRKD